MKQRQSNFELLRIISIFLVIAVHVVGVMIPIAYPEKSTWKFCAAVYSVAHTAVPIFIMLTGYFSYSAQTKITHVLKKISLPYLFYALLFLVYLIVFNPFSKTFLEYTGGQIEALASTKGGFFTGQMWYIYVLAAVMLLSPYINMLIEKLDRNSHKKLLIILFVLFFGIPTLNALLDMQLFYVFQTYSVRNMLALMICYYILGSYFAKYDIKLKKLTSLSLFVGTSVLIYLLSYFWSVYHPGAELVKLFTRSFIISQAEIDALHEGSGFSMYFMDYNSAFILISSSALLLFFKELKVKQSKVINFLASLTFGMYINHLFVKELVSGFLPSSYMVFGTEYMKIATITICAIFAFSMAIEAVRVGFVRLFIVIFSRKRDIA